MTPSQFGIWCAKRAELFPVALDRATRANIDTEIPHIEFESAMAGLAKYREVKPYRGFWMDRYLRCVRAIESEPRANQQADSAQGGAAATEAAKDAEAIEFREHIHREYSRLDPSIKAQATAFAATTIFRSWKFGCMMMALRWAAGEDLSTYVVKPKPRCETTSTRFDFEAIWGARIAQLEAENAQLRSALDLAARRLTA